MFNSQNAYKTSNIPTPPASNLQKYTSSVVGENTKQATYSMENDKTWIFLCLQIAVMVDICLGHGRLDQPPGRSTAWRYGFGTPVNYNDNQLNCGGFSVQYGANNGNCGVCGDNWSDAAPRAHENGGTYGTGTIVETYTQGQQIDVTVELTASHMGWFEFRLCAHDNPSTPVTQACLDENVLESIGGDTRFFGITQSGTYNYILKLPADIACTQCVLQWKYHCGNNWGSDSEGVGLGFGDQEEFYGCADIAIEASGGNQDPTTTTTSTTTTSTTSSPSNQDPPTTTTTTTSTTSPTTTTTSTTSSTTTSAGSGGGTVCVATSVYAAWPTMDQWCATNCAAGYCPATHCVCTSSKKRKRRGIRNYRKSLLNKYNRA